LTAYGYSYTPELASSFLFVNARVTVLPEITLFIRGDTDGDAAVNMTDAVATFNYLFLGGVRPHCLDAADADDDGAINLTDGIFALEFLFLGGRRLPAPFPTVKGFEWREPPPAARRSMSPPSAPARSGC
jgi:hypothetical protein